jgi:predicted metal-dependent peptidase
MPWCWRLSAPSAARRHDRNCFTGKGAPLTCRIVENAIVRLLKDRPFYGYLLAGIRKSSSDSCFPLGITIRQGIPTLTFNEPLLAGFSQEEQEALLEHCVLHLLHLHPSRRKERSRHDWDIASDLAINPLLEKMPLSAPRPEYFRLPDGLSAEEYYLKLVDPFDTGNLKGSGTGTADQEDAGMSGDGPTETGHAPVDDHTAWDEADSTPLRLAEEMVREMARDAGQKCGGELPGELRQLLESLLAPPDIPWRMVLRQFIATAGRVGHRSTWQRENRRFTHATPGNRKRQRLNLLIGVDVSDSTNAPELREAFAREIVHISRGRECHLTVAYASSRIQRIESFRSSTTQITSYYGGGFTDLRPLFEYARTMHPRPAAVIYLTDGLGPAPAEMEFPTLWVLTAEGEKPAPWGVELRLEV